VWVAAHGAPPTRRILSLFWSRFTKKLEPNFKAVSSAACGALASERVGSNIPLKAEQRKTQKFYLSASGGKNFLNFKGATGGTNKKLLSVVRLRH